MPITKSNFKPAWWLPNAHLQTIWSTFFRKTPHLKFNNLNLTLDDGDFIDLSVIEHIADTTRNKPIILF